MKTFNRFKVFVKMDHHIIVDLLLVANLKTYIMYVIQNKKDTNIEIF